MIVFNMGAQTNKISTLKSKRTGFENKMIEKGKDYLMFKYYHLGEPTDVKKLIHLRNLHRAYSTKDCEVQEFIKKQSKVKHNYLGVENTRRCEEIDICYNNIKE